MRHGCDMGQVAGAVAHQDVLAVQRELDGLVLLGRQRERRRATRGDLLFYLFVLFCFDWMVSSRHAPRAKRSAFLALALAAVVLVCGEMCGGEGASEGAEVLTAARSGLLTGLHMAMGRPSP